jgi:hypothetical protein
MEKITNPSQTVEDKFELRRTYRDLLHKQGYDLQVWCALLIKMEMMKIQVSTKKDDELDTQT